MYKFDEKSYSLVFTYLPVAQPDSRFVIPHIHRPSPSPIHFTIGTTQIFPETKFTEIYCIQQKLPRSLYPTKVCNSGSKFSTVFPNLHYSVSKA